MNIILLFIAIIYAFFIIFIAVAERKNISNLIAWELIVLIFFILGFLAYIVFGNRLKIKAKKQLLIKEKSTKNYLKLTNWYKNYNRNNLNNLTKMQKKIAKYNLNNFNSNLWHNNKLKIYTSGHSFLEDLIKDLQNAKSTINIMFYIFADDKTGKLIKDVLIEKAKQGIVVNLLYDYIGSYKTSYKFWMELKNAGINVYPFFPSTFSLGLINFKINYRNHKKIIVIDGKISYTGGVNLRDDHMGMNKKLFPWYDTQLKIIGSASYVLQNLFFNDWCFSNNKKLSKEQIDLYFPEIKYNSGETLQILSSGAQKDKAQIKDCYIKIIKSAKEFLYILTPYFIVDDTLLNLIINAKNRGVDVRVYIPQKPDKKMVYAGTLLCIKKLIKNNVSVFLYNGFLHSKVLICENVLSVGSCNFDNRSFYLNFENTCLIYNKRIIFKHKNLLEKQMANCKKLSIKMHKRISSNGIVFRFLYNILYKLL